MMPSRPLRRALCVIGLAAFPAVFVHAGAGAAPIVVFRGPRPTPASPMLRESRGVMARAILLVYRSTAVQDTAPLYFEYQVEEPARVIEWERPHYPDSLKTAKVEGEVLIQFVVGLTGQMERGSARILRASHAAFARAVIATLGSAQFTPAVLDIEEGQRVRQIVQQSFLFALKR